MFQKKFVEKVKDTFYVRQLFFQKSCLYEIMWTNVTPEMPQITIWCMYIACWINNAADIHL